MEYNILSWLIWLPIVGVAAIALIPREKEDFIKITSAVTTGLQFLLTLVLWNNFDAANGQIQFKEQYEWIPSFNIEYFFRGRWVESSNGYFDWTFIFSRCFC